MPHFHDYATYLLSAEKNLRQLGDDLLHNRHDNVEEKVLSILKSLTGVLLWVDDAKQK